MTTPITMSDTMVKARPLCVRSELSFMTTSLTNVITVATVLFSVMAAPRVASPNWSCVFSFETAPE